MVNHPQNSQFSPEWLEENNRRIVFQTHMYNCSGRANSDHPMHGLFTGLWQDFCLNEAGIAQRDQWFDRMQFVQDVKEGKINALNNEVGINSGHANYIATEKIDKAARNYHIAKVVILTLVLASSKKTPTTLDEVNQIQADWIRACENEDLFK